MGMGINQSHIVSGCETRGKGYFCAMAKAKQKYYVVWVGEDPGIYTTWPEARRQIDGFPGAKYKSYPSLEQAEAAFAQGHEQALAARKTGRPHLPYPVYKDLLGNEIPLPAWGVDAACSGVPGPVEYRCVDLENGDVLFHKGPFKAGTNNIGEFLALVHALAYLKLTGETDVTVYTDSRTALAWLRNKKAKTTLKRQPANRKLFELVARAERWLQDNNSYNPVRKWKTEEWGEIPADFGRK